jgi:hypothetical protein
MTKARFHFELFWPKFDDHDETIAQAWQQPIKASDPLARLDSMLRTMVQELQRWSTTRIGEIKAQLLMARELVLRLDTAQELQQLSKEESGLHRHMKMRCLGLSSLERTMLDRDRKSDSSVKGTLMVTGHVRAEHEATEDALHQHFSEVFGTAAARGITLDFQALGIH